MTSDSSWVDRLNDPDVVLGAHVNSLRFLKRCSQEELGRVIGVSQSTMAKKLRGAISISFAELLQLAAFFDLAVEDMVPAQYAGERRLAQVAGESNQAPAIRPTPGEVVRQQGLEPRTRCFGGFAPDLQLVLGGAA